MTPPPRRSIGLLGVAIMAIASSAVLVRWADAPAIGLAFWRTLGGAVVLAPSAVNERAKPTRSTVLALVGAGVALAVHFSAWLASLEMTSVAASVTLVSTAPIFVAFFAWSGGGPKPTMASWGVIMLTLIGVTIIASGDLLANSDTSTEGLIGDGLALVGAIAMAAYLVLGGRARQELSTAGYAARSYAVAATVLLPTALATRTDLWGYDRTTWLVIGAMILGPQLAGHTMLNLLLQRLGSLTVSLALLAEPVGAAALTWVLLNEAPPAVAWIGSPIVLAGLALHLVMANGQPNTSRAAASSS